MTIMEAEGLLKSYRKKPLFDPDQLPNRLNADQPIIEKLIPHRPPLLFVDRLVAIDLAQGRLAGERHLEPTDPVFSGHFPNFPIYPGNFTVETIGQMGLCLYYFAVNRRTDVAGDAQPVQLRATKVLGALFQEPILPGDRLTVLCQQLSFDGYFACMIGQAMVRGKIAVVTIGEVVILND